MHDPVKTRDALERAVSFFTLTERLKNELRHSWLSSGRRESVAEHSWRMALMVLTLAPVLEQSVDVQRCLMMAIVHDLAEVVTGDVPVHAPRNEVARHQAEVAAMNQLFGMLPDDLTTDMRAAWEEYEERQSYEALFVRALDKLEVQLQHVEAPIETWEPHEKLMIFQERWARRFATFDAAMRQLSDIITEQGEAKLRANGDNTDMLRAQAVAAEAAWQRDSLKV